jgi:ppGpp synthetase/RelA/SpoT-type nucleotidyltranferase
VSIEDARREYERVSVLWQRLGQRLLGEIASTLGGRTGFHSIAYRVKSWSSIEQKLARIGTDDLARISDAVGIRILLTDHSEITYIINFLSSILVFESDTPQFTEWRDEPRFQSVHMFGKLASTTAHLRGWQELMDIRVEIQVRSIFAQAWAEIEHFFDYKLPNNAPAATKLRAATSETDRLQDRLTEFETLIDNPAVHEKRDVHAFLTEHPFILHPNPDMLESEVSIGLGTEYRMDFLIREAEKDYVVVEIENPRHPVITQRGDISAPVNHALQQVEDWQEWIEDNLPTVQRYYPDISAPKGLVIIGRSKSFTRVQQRKLARRNINLSGRVKIITYDDLLARARTYISSLRDTLSK